MDEEEEDGVGGAGERRICWWLKGDGLGLAPTSLGGSGPL